MITREVVEPLGMDPDLVRVPADRGPIEAAGESYERAITEAGGIDLQVLGIGRTGHIGFNEPGSSFASLTRVKTLTEQTRLDNARFFPSLEDVPTHCVTQGLGTIMRARHLVLLAFGEAKADAVAGAVEGPVTSSLPAPPSSCTRRSPVIVDEAAAAKLGLRGLLQVRVGPPAGVGARLAQTWADSSRVCRYEPVIGCGIGT